jgi:hypothetical protein
VEGDCASTVAPSHGVDRIGTRNPPAPDGLRSLLVKRSSAA